MNTDHLQVMRKPGPSLAVAEFIFPAFPARLDHVPDVPPPVPPAPPHVPPEVPPELPPAPDHPPVPPEQPPIQEPPPQPGKIIFFLR